jgi:hypothetical protein
MTNFLCRLGLAAMVCVASIASAHDGSVWNERHLAQNDHRSEVRLGMGKAIEMAQRQAGGRVLSAQESRQDRREGYRIKVLSQSGEVRVHFVDVQNGAIRQD